MAEWLTRRAFATTLARACPMTAARRRTWGRLAAWAGLDLGDDIAGEVLRCPAPGAERVDGREHSFLLQTRHYQGLQRDQAAAGAGVFVALFVPSLVFAPVPQP